MTLSVVRLVNQLPCSISVFHQQDIHQIVQVGFDEPGSVAANVQDERGAHDICVLCMHYYECRYRSCASTAGGRVAPTLLVYTGALSPFLPLYLTVSIKIHSIPVADFARAGTVPYADFRDHVPSLPAAPVTGANQSTSNGIGLFSFC